MSACDRDLKFSLYIFVQSGDHDHDEHDVDDDDVDNDDVDDDGVDDDNVVNDDVNDNDVHNYDADNVDNFQEHICTCGAHTVTLSGPATDEKSWIAIATKYGDIVTWYDKVQYARMYFLKFTQMTKREILIATKATLLPDIINWSGDDVFWYQNKNEKIKRAPFPRWHCCLVQSIVIW